MSAANLQAGKLRHRIRIERPDYQQDPLTGDMVASWLEFATVWAAIEYLSAREFVASSAEQSEIVARITIRYLAGIDATMRIVHEPSAMIYDIKGVLPDLKSGKKYLTMPVSEGVRIDDDFFGGCLFVTDEGIRVTNNGAYVRYCGEAPETFNVLNTGNNVINDGNHVVYLGD